MSPSSRPPSPSRRLQGLLSGTTSQPTPDAEAPGREPVLHDFTKRGWGHDFSYRLTDDPHVLRGHCWDSTPVSVGDLFLFPHSGNSRLHGRTSRYRAIEVSCSRDPHDMYFCVWEWVPRTEAEMLADHERAMS